MFFHQRFLPGLAIASYIVGDEKTKDALVVDPTRDVEEYIRIAREEGLRIRHILETHVHADYVSGAVELKDRLGGEATIHCSSMGGADWTAAYADRQVNNGEEIVLGQVRATAIHTPGHTPEHVMWAVYDDGRSKQVPWLLLSGDFLFVGDVGRPDLLGEEARKTLAGQLYKSVFKILPGFADFTEVFPGHGAGSLCGKAIGSRRSSTLGYERQFNASLTAMPEGQWVEKLLKGMPLAPPYFRRMKAVNVKGPKVLGAEFGKVKPFSAREVHARICEHCMVVDVRPKEAFAAAHIPGAINVPMGPSLPTWAGWVLPYEKHLLIVPSRPAEVQEVVTNLMRVGLDQVGGYLEDGMDAWENLGYPVGQLESWSVQNLEQAMKSPAKHQPYVLDVRTESEWAGGHIDGAHHIHGGLLQDRYVEVPRDRMVAVICGSGYRGSIAASFLKSCGYSEVANVLGGMMAWKASGKGVVSSGARG